MRAKLIKDCYGPNPRWDWCKTQQQQPNTPCQIIKKAGTIIEGPKVWIHIADGIAEAADDEARAWVAKNDSKLAAHAVAVEDIRRAQLAAIGDADGEDEDEDELEGDDDE